MNASDANGDPSLVFQLLGTKQFLGFKLENEAVLRIPNLFTFNSQLKRISKILQKPIAYLGVWETSVYGYSNQKYINSWAEGKILIGASGHLKIHDLSVHFLNLIWPRFLQKIQIRIATAYRDLIKFQIVSGGEMDEKNKRTFEIFQNLAAAFLDNMSEISVALKKHFLDKKLSKSAFAAKVRTFVFRATSMRPLLGDTKPRVQCLEDMLRLLLDHPESSGRFLRYEGETLRLFNAQFRTGRYKFMTDGELQILLDDNKLVAAFEKRFEALRKASK